MSQYAFQNFIILTEAVCNLVHKISVRFACDLFVSDETVSWHLFSFLCSIMSIKNVVTSKKNIHMASDLIHFGIAYCSMNFGKKWNIFDLYKPIFISIHLLICISTESSFMSNKNVVTSKINNKHMASDLIYFGTAFYFGKT
jgi:hypothetical protein